MPEDMFQLVSHHLVQHFGIEPESISPTATLEDIGLDSMALVELLLVLEEEFGMPMPDDDAATPKTLGELVERLDRARRELATAGEAGAATEVPAGAVAASAPAASGSGGGAVS